MAKVKVKNRAFGTTLYTIPEFKDKINLTRIFGSGEVKEIDEEELEALTFVAGGFELLKNYLQILDPECAERLVYDKEPEYDMSEADIKTLMTVGSYDAFLDCLDFAPKGVLELIKEYSVTLPLNDSAKREAIKEKLGFDVNQALAFKREDEEEVAASADKKRRVQVAEPAEQAAAPVRRTTSKYNVVTK